MHIIRSHFIVCLFLCSQSISQPLKVRPLEGRKLHCCALEQPPIVFRNPNRQPHGFDGLAIDYLQALQERLGFTCTSLVFHNNNRSKDIGFNAFIDRLEACSENGVVTHSPDCSCDIGVAGFVLNDKRFSRVDYLPPFVMDTIAVLVHVNNTYSSNRHAFFLTAFSTGVWISMLILAFLFIFLKMLDKRFSPPATDFAPLPKSEYRFRRFKHFLLKSRLLYRLRRAFQSTFDYWIRLGIDDQNYGPPSTRQWVLNAVIVLCGLFLVLTYESSMTASLVQESLGSAYSSVDSFVSCRIPADQVCMPKGGAVHAFWNHVMNSSRCSNSKVPQKYEEYSEGVQWVQSGKCKYLLALGSKIESEVRGKYCGILLQTGRPCHEGGVSFVLPKNSTLTNPMGRATLQLIQENSISTLIQYLSRKKSCDFEKQSSLTFEKLKVFFILAYVVCALIFLEMVLDPQEELNHEQELQSEIIDEKKEKEPTSSSGRHCELSVGSEID